MARFRGWPCVAVAVCLLVPSVARAERTLDEHRYFRALTIDLQGRVPTRTEVAAFESPTFDVDAFIDTRLASNTYGSRLSRVYMDALRLEIGDNFQFNSNITALRRFSIRVQELDGTSKDIWVYHRGLQRRPAAAFDRGFCFNAADTGQTFARNRLPDPVVPTKLVPRAVFEQRVAKVRPWWLYRDFRSATPVDHYSSWQATAPRFVLGLPTDRTGPATAPNDTRLLVNADGSATTDVYVCKEEAQTTPSATVTVNGQSVDVSCSTDLGHSLSSACGCGKGLELCMPGAGASGDPASFALSTLAPLGSEEPFESARQSQSDWWRRAWGEEARRYLDGLFVDDRDFREVLTGRHGVINGPMAQFYRAAASGDCCSDQVGLGTGATYATPEHLFEPSRVPADLLPHEMDRWVKVANRGPKAAGVLTLPAFLAKFASRRGRANAVYNAFLCREFVAENVKLEPSTEPNLTLRSGCATCHAKLEPLAAYFARTKESSFSWIAAPVDNPDCKVPAGAAPSRACVRYYDPEFSTTSSGQLRGAYGSVANVEKGPVGLAQEVVSSPEFSACVARTVTESFLGRRTASPADDGMLRELDKALVDGGYRIRPLVRSIIKSNAYRNANSLAGRTL